MLTAVAAALAKEDDNCFNSIFYLLIGLLHSIIVLCTSLAIILVLNLTPIYYLSGCSIQYSVRLDNMKYESEIILDGGDSAVAGKKAQNPSNFSRSCVPMPLLLRQYHDWTTKQTTPLSPLPRTMVSEVSTATSKTSRVRLLTSYPPPPTCSVSFSN